MKRLQIQIIGVIVIGAIWLSVQYFILPIFLSKKEDLKNFPIVTATIVGEGNNGQSGKRRRTHFEVKFITQEGQERTANYEADTTFTTNKIGDVIELRYDPSYPTRVYDEETYEFIKDQK